MITVVGSGFSGLSAAYFLSKAGFAVEVYEKATRVGGLLDTMSTPHGLIETAANGIVTTPLVENMARDIGVNLLKPLKSSRKRYIFRRGRPHRWPMDIPETV